MRSTQLQQETYKKQMTKKATWSSIVAAGKKRAVSVIRFSHLIINRHVPDSFGEPRGLMGSEFFRWKSGLLCLPPPFQAGTKLCQEIELGTVRSASDGNSPRFPLDRSLNLSGHHFSVLRDLG